MTALAGYAWVALTVSDLDASVDWYQRVFALEVSMTDADTCVVGEEVRFTYLVDPASFFVVGLQQTAEVGRSSARERAGLAGFAVNVGEARLTVWLRRLDNLGVVYRGPTPWATGTVVHLEDLDGIPLLLFEPAAVEA